MKKIILTGLCVATSLMGLAQSAQADSIWDMPQPTILSKSQTGFNDQPFQAYVQEERVALPGTNQFRLNPNQLKLKYDHNVSTYFINEGAGYRNQLGYVASGTTNQSGLIFKDISCTGASCKGDWGGSALKLGDGVNLGKIEAKTNLDFKLRADGLRRGNDAYVFGTPDTDNPDKLQHVVAYGIEGTGYILLGFEDLYGNSTVGGGKFNEESDRDFNDSVFVLDVGKKNVDAFLGKDVPEPSIMLSLLGLTAAGALKLRRRKGDEA